MPLPFFKTVWAITISLFIACTPAQASVKTVSDSLAKVLNSSKNDTANVRILLHLSNIWLDSSISRSLTYAMEARRISKDIGWGKGRVLASFAGAACYTAIKDWDKALQYYTEGENLAAQDNLYRDMQTALMSIANVYYLSGKEDSQLVYKLKALTLARSMSDIYTQARLLTDLGGYYLDTDHQRSLSYWQEARDLLNESNKPDPIAMSLNNLAVLYLKMKQGDSAIHLLHQALIVLQRAPGSHSKPYIYTTISDYFKETGRLDSAIFYSKAAAGIAAQPVPDKYVQEAALEQLYALYKRTDQPAKALEAYTQYISIRDSNKEETQLADEGRLIRKYEYELQAKVYEAQHKALSEKSNFQQKELFVAYGGLLVLAILAGVYYYLLLQNRRKSKTITYQSAELMVQKQTIQNSLREKETLMKEIHHRVKNNLQVISALLQLQGRRSTDMQVKEALTESQNRVLSIAFIHQNLYQHNELGGIEMKDFVRELIKHLDTIYRPPNLQIDITQNITGRTLDMDIAVPLGLILNELLTNSYKYAFAGRTEGLISISISYNDAEQKYKLEYRDDGPGLPLTLDPNAGKTLGLTLVHDLCRQLGGTPIYTTGNGFRLEFDFEPGQN